MLRFVDGFVPSLIQPSLWVLRQQEVLELFQSFGGKLHRIKKPPAKLPVPIDLQPASMLGGCQPLRFRLKCCIDPIQRDRIKRPAHIVKPSPTIWTFQMIKPYPMELLCA